MKRQGFPAALCSAPSLTLALTMALALALSSCGTIFSGGIVQAPVFVGILPDTDPSYASPQRLILKSATSGALVRYTLDGSVPSSSYGALYDGIPIELTETVTVRAIAFRSGWTDSGVVTGIFNIIGSLSPPSIHPAAGRYKGAQTVTMSSSNPGALIRFRTDGFAPTPESGTVYSAPIRIDATTSFQAIAYRSGWNSSALASATIVVEPYSLATVSIPASFFFMGTDEVGDAFATARPKHKVNLSAYAIGLTEIGQKLYSEVTGSNPSAFSSAPDWESRPVEKVTWYDAAEFCNALSARDALDPFYTIRARNPATGHPIASATVTIADLRGGGYRLPTEAEWEYAARGGPDGADSGHLYSGSSVLGDVAWHAGNSGASTKAVAGRAANELGVFDMTGNVAEWCQDWYAEYGAAEADDPQGGTAGTLKGVRGGDWTGADPASFRTVFRDFWTPAQALTRAGYDTVGFRVARSLTAFE